MAYASHFASLRSEAVLSICHSPLQVPMLPKLSCAAIQDSGKRMFTAWPPLTEGRRRPPVNIRLIVYAELVAKAPRSVNQLGALEGPVDFGAQVANVDFERVGQNVGVVIPNVRDDV